MAFNKANPANNADLVSAEIRANWDAIEPRGLIVSIGSAGGGVITTGVKVYVYIPAAMRITGWTLLADASGSIVIDVWKDTYANFPPTVADTIAGSEKPTLSAQQKNQDVALSSWTTDLAPGDVLAFKVDSAATVQQATLTLHAVLI